MQRPLAVATALYLHNQNPPDGQPLPFLTSSRTIMMPCCSRGTHRSPRTTKMGVRDFQIIQWWWRGYRPTIILLLLPFAYGGGLPNKLHQDWGLAAKCFKYLQLIKVCCTFEAKEEPGETLNNGKIISLELCCKAWKEQSTSSARREHARTAQIHMCLRGCCW